MLIAERRRLIAEQLQAAGRVVVSELSAGFGVSEETIRRDLEWLEKEGVANRTYGGAVASQGSKAPPPYAIRKNTNVEEKLAIARQVAAMVEDGDAIMVDESSTAACAVQAMGQRKNLTLITNSLEILHEMGGREGWSIISTGGSMKGDVMALTGPHALRTIRCYHVRYAILSCRGINTRLGIADSSDDIVQVKQAMIEAADCAVLLADHRKFDRTGLVSLGPLGAVARVVTDREPPAEWRKRFEEQEIALYCNQ